ncbi:MAG: Uncharacterised protein [Bacteroidetes bacterium MED-G17]|nr:MAG: Uncharacterised protein [Bacteroidetes bacterium MED-G17]
MVVKNRKVQLGLVACFLLVLGILSFKSFNNNSKLVDSSDDKKEIKLAPFLDILEENDYKSAEKTVKNVLNGGNLMSGVDVLKNQVLSSNPNNEIALYYLGIWSIQSGQLVKAKEKFEKLVFLHPQKKVYQQKLLEINQKL